MCIRDRAHSGARFSYEATVGAGLPVISTLRDLLDTGDDLLSIEGIFSGTLAWLFNKYDGSKPFSELVLEAHALGSVSYTHLDVYKRQTDNCPAPLQAGPMNSTAQRPAHFVQDSPFRGFQRLSLIHI